MEYESNLTNVVYFSMYDGDLCGDLDEYGVVVGLWSAVC